QLPLFSTPPAIAQQRKAIAFPTWLMKNRRMTPAIAEKLSQEIGQIEAVIAGCDPHLNLLLRVLLSDAIARHIRMRFLGTGVGRFSLTFSQTPIPRIFMKSLEQYAKVVAACEWLRATLHLPFAQAEVTTEDARNIPGQPGDFDILVTSPPYLPAS